MKRDIIKIMPEVTALCVRSVAEWLYRKELEAIIGIIVRTVLAVCMLMKNPETGLLSVVDIWSP